MRHLRRLWAMAYREAAADWGTTPEAVDAFTYQVALWLVKMHRRLQGRPVKGGEER